MLRSSWHRFRADVVRPAPHRRIFVVLRRNKRFCFETTTSSTECANRVPFRGRKTGGKALEHKTIGRVAERCAEYARLDSMERTYPTRHPGECRERPTPRPPIATQTAYGVRSLKIRPFSQNSKRMQPSRAIAWCTISRSWHIMVIRNAPRNQAYFRLAFANSR